MTTLTVPTGFEPATADDFTDRLDGWVGPTIVDEDGTPIASATWTPEGELKRYINSDIYPDSTCDKARGILAWLDALIEEPAEACPIDGCSLMVSEHDKTGTHVFYGQWIESGDETMGPLLSLSPTKGPAGAGVSAEIPYELFESLGAVVDGGDCALAFRASEAAMSEIFAALVEIGTKGQALLASGRMQAPALTPRTTRPRRVFQRGVPVEQA